MNKTTSTASKTTSITTINRTVAKTFVQKISNNASDSERLQGTSTPQFKGGKGVMKFCRNLAASLVRQYMLNDNAVEIRESLVPSLISSLNCSRQQAEALADLSLEIIHEKVHGKYRHTDIELSFLIAAASGEVADVAVN